jgi:hypothetical protein
VVGREEVDLLIAADEAVRMLGVGLEARRDGATEVDAGGLLAPIGW